MPTGRSSLYVLVVEGGEDYRRLAEQVLTCSGFEVVAVPTAHAAISRLEGSARPAVIVLDLMLPLMNGWELLAWLAKRHGLSAIPVVIVSVSPHVQRARALHP